MSNDRIYYSRNAAMHASRTKTLLTLVFLTFGLAIGTALALLFAPTSGKTARHEFAKNIEDGMHSGRETVEPLVKRLEAEFADFRKSVEERLKHN